MLDVRGSGNITGAESSAKQAAVREIYENFMLHSVETGNRRC